MARVDADPAFKAAAVALVHQARRMGKIVVGVRLTRDEARSGRARATLVAGDLSARRRQVLEEGLERAGVDVYGGWRKEELGELTGKPAVAALTITDRHIADGLRRLADGQASEKERNRG